MIDEDKKLGSSFVNVLPMILRISLTDDWLCELMSDVELLGGLEMNDVSRETSFGVIFGASVVTCVAATAETFIVCVLMICEGGIVAGGFAGLGGIGGRDN